MHDHQFFYKHSGKIDITKLLIMSIFLILSALVSFVYAYLLVYIPLVGYVNILLTIGLILAFSFLGNIALKIVKTRNNKAAFVLGLLFSSFSFYFSWVCFEFVLINRYGDGINWFELVQSPLTVLGIMFEIAESGWYSIKSYTPTGAVLWIMWAIEGLIVVGTSTYTIFNSLKEDVFCENCGEWTEDQATPLVFNCKNESLVEELKQQNPSLFKDFSGVHPQDVDYFQISGQFCKTCEELKTISLFEIKRSWDSDGKAELKDKNILLNLFFKPENYAQLFELVPKLELEVEQRLIDEAEIKDQEEKTATT